MKRILLILFMVLILLTAGGLLWSRSTAVRPPAWQTQKLDRGDLELTVPASGGVEPTSVVQVGSQVSGKVRSVAIEADQKVQKDQLLALLDTELLEADLRDRQFQLQKAQLNLETIALERENLCLREERLAVAHQRARIALEQGRAFAELKQKNLERNLDLRKADAAVETEIDSLRLEKENAVREIALRELEIRNLAFDQAQLKTELKALEIRAADGKNQIEQAKQVLAKSETNLKYATILAPIDGVVLERSIEPGQTIAASFQTPNLFKIAADLQTIRVMVQIDEADVGKIRPGQAVTFHVDAFKDEEFSGTVSAVRLQNQTRANLITYPVVIEARNPVAEGYPNGRLRPGMTAYVTFKVGLRKQALRLPAAALRFTPPKEAGRTATAEAGAGKDTAGAGKKAQPPSGTGKDKPKEPGLPATVYLTTPDGRLRTLTVRVGENDGEYYEVLGGDLKAGDEVVTGQSLAAQGPSQEKADGEND